MGKKNLSKYLCNIVYFRKRIDEFLKGEIRIEDIWIDNYNMNWKNYFNFFNFNIYSVY